MSKTRDRLREAVKAVLLEAQTHHMRGSAAVVHDEFLTELREALKADEEGDE